MKALRAREWAACNVLYDLYASLAAKLKVDCKAVFEDHHVPVTVRSRFATVLFMIDQTTTPSSSRALLAHLDDC